MTTSTSRQAYADCFDLYDRALESSYGIRNGPFKGSKAKGKAHQWRTRLHYARTVARDEAREIYEPDDPKFGISAYDHLIVRIHEDADGWWVYIEPRAVTGEVQELGAAE